MYANEDPTLANAYMSIDKSEYGHRPIPGNKSVSFPMNNCNRMTSSDSGCVSPTAEEAILLNHDYADPIQLKDSIRFEMKEIDRKKRQNLIYEPMTAKSKGKGSRNDNNNNYSSKSNGSGRVCTLHNWCLVFVFIVSLCSLGLCLLITLGILDIKASNRQDQPTADKLINAMLDDEDKLLEYVKKNISILNKQIPSFVRQLGALQVQLKQLSVKINLKPSHSITTTLSPQAAVKKGLSKCRYKTETNIGKYHELPEKTIVKTLWLNGGMGHELVGASCSTKGGLQHGLFTKSMRGKEYFQCRCAGKALTKAFQSGSDELQCTMHYWECPIRVR